MRPLPENCSRRKQPPPVRISGSGTFSPAVWSPRWQSHASRKALPVNPPINRIW
ncbi:MAG: hypothetical protein LBI75_07305 [Brucellaceae bacterium]|nr:hypothetical protein [Brucellaceae bacterium]